MTTLMYVICIQLFRRWLLGLDSFPVAGIHHGGGFQPPFRASSPAAILGSARFWPLLTTMDDRRGRVVRRRFLRVVAHADLLQPLALGLPGNTEPPCRFAL